MTDTRKQMGWALLGAALVILLPLAAIAARSWGWIEDPEGDLPSRLYGVTAGLIVAAYGNIIPRKLVRYDPDSPRPAARQAAIRFSGWAFVLGGLASAVVWMLVSPIDRAAMLSMVPLALALILVIARCARLTVQTRA